MSQLNASDATCATLLQQLYDQSEADWPEPLEAISMEVRLNLLDTLQEEMIVMLPENLFQGLNPEQNQARISFR